VTKSIAGIRVGRAFLGPDLTPTDDVWALFHGDLIAGIGTGRPPMAVPEFPDAVLLPGLVDCHVHLALSGTSDVETEVSQLSTDGLRAAVLRNAQAQVRSGVTTVRDLGSPADLVVAMASELSHGAAHVAPTVVAAGAITSPQGHGHFLAREAEGVDGYSDAVTAVADIGAAAVKLFATGGVVTHGTTPGNVQMSLEELQAATVVAHERGLRVAVHAHGHRGIVNAVAAGVDSVEHFSYLAPDVIDALTTSGAWLVSTLVATERFVGSEDRTSASPETLEKILEHAPHERSALRLAVESRARLAVGTDAGTTFNPHGGGMQEEARLLQSAGMTTRDVLRALTAQGARLLGEPAGELSVGRRADLVLVEGDPLSDLDTLSRMHGVIVRGRLLDIHATLLD
jgi:imidazolonepropionase-like amidohydrolase